MPTFILCAFACCYNKRLLAVICYCCLGLGLFLLQVFPRAQRKLVFSVGFEFSSKGHYLKLPLFDCSSFGNHYLTVLDFRCVLDYCGFVLLMNSGLVSERITVKTVFLFNHKNTEIFTFIDDQSPRSLQDWYLCSHKIHLTSRETSQNSFWDPCLVIITIILGYIA